MVNFVPQIKPSHRITQLIARIEKASGLFQGSLSNIQFALEDKKEKALQLNTLASIALDHTSPAQLSSPILSFFKGNTQLDFISSSPLSTSELNSLNGLENGFKFEFELSDKGINSIYKSLFEEEDNTDFLRTSSLPFYSHLNQRIFTTVSSFLVPRRLKEVIEWANEELEREEVHPLLIIGIFHLLFLQLHPFKTANHRCALVINWHLLINQGYSYLEFDSFIYRLLLKSNLYYRTLKHSESSAFGDWSTIGVWLEFYLSALLESATIILEEGKTHLNKSLLNDTQKKIIETIRSHGALNREKIVAETGINLSTIKYNLNILSEKGHLIKEGAGRSTSYRVI